MALAASDIEASYLRVERGLFNVLYRLVWDAPACQDILQDTFLRLWSRRDELHATHIDALAYTTALNLARNRLRWGKLRRWVGLEVLDDIAEFPALEEARRVALLDLRDALSSLAPSDREIVLLSEYGGFDTEQLAAMLGIAAGTVGSRKHRALTRLREQMKGSADD